MIQLLNPSSSSISAFNQTSPISRSNVAVLTPTPIYGSAQNQMTDILSTSASPSTSSMMSAFTLINPSSQSSNSISSSSYSFGSPLTSGNISSLSSPSFSTSFAPTQLNTLSSLASMQSTSSASTSTSLLPPSASATHTLLIHTSSIGEQTYEIHPYNVFPISVTPSSPQSNQQNIPTAPVLQLLQIIGSNGQPQQLLIDSSSNNNTNNSNQIYQSPLSLQKNSLTLLNSPLQSQSQSLSPLIRLNSAVPISPNSLSPIQANCSYQTMYVLPSSSMQNNQFAVNEKISCVNNSSIAVPLSSNVSSSQSVTIGVPVTQVPIPANTPVASHSGIMTTGVRDIPSGPSKSVLSTSNQSKKRRHSNDTELSVNSQQSSLMSSLPSSPLSPTIHHSSAYSQPAHIDGMSSSRLLTHISKQPAHILTYCVHKSQIPMAHLSSSTLVVNDIVSIKIRVMGGYGSELRDLFFVAADISQLIHSRKSNIAKAVSSFNDKEKARMPILCPRSNATVSTHILTVLTLDGVKRLLQSSRAAIAGPFLKWLINEVERIRKNQMKNPNLKTNYIANTNKCEIIINSSSTPLRAKDDFSPPLLTTRYLKSSSSTVSLDSINSSSPSTPTTTGQALEFALISDTNSENSDDTGNLNTLLPSVDISEKINDSISDDNNELSESPNKKYKLNDNDIKLKVLSVMS